MGGSWFESNLGEPAELRDREVDLHRGLRAEVRLVVQDGENDMASGDCQVQMEAEIGPGDLKISRHSRPERTRLVATLSATSDSVQAPQTTLFCCKTSVTLHLESLRPSEESLTNSATSFP